MSFTGFSGGFSGANSFATSNAMSAQQVQTNVQRAAVRLINAPSELQNTQRPTSVQGEVVSQPTEKSFLIRTDRGDVEVRPRGNQKLEIGQQVKVDIPAGSSARDVLVSRVDAPPAPVTTDTTRTNLENLTKGEKAVQLSRESNLRTAVLNETSRNAVIRQRAGDLPVGTLVRIKSIPQKTAAAILSENAKLVAKVTSQITQNSGQINANTKAVPQNTQIQSLPLPVLNALPVSMSTAQVPQVTSALISNILGLNNTGIDFQGIKNPTVARIPVQVSATPLSQNVTQSGGVTKFIPNAPQGVSSPISQSSLLPSSLTNGALQGQVSGSVSGQIITNETTSTPLYNHAQIDGRVRSFSGFVPAQSLQNSYGGNVAQSANGALPSQPQGSAVLQGSASSSSFQIIGTTQQGNVLLQPLGLSASTGGLSSVQTPPVFLLNYPIKNPVVGQTLHLSPISAQSFTNTGFAPLDGAWGALFAHMTQGGATQIPVLQALQSVVPQMASPMQSTSSLMFLMAAFQGGAVEGLVGTKNLSETKNGKTIKLLESVLKEGGTSSKLIQTGSGDWRAYSLPLQHQEQYAPIHLYVQDHGAQQDNHGGIDDDEIDATRFVFEFDLTRMGELQIDGMMRDTNVDIFVRTEKPVSSEMARGMKSLYTKALERSDLTGDIAFQTKDKGWVDLVAVEPSQEFTGTTT